MTIDSEWIKLFKQQDNSAFHKLIPIRPDVAFIDGQIRLQKGKHIQTWTDLINFNFVRTVEKWFKTGAKTVVLAFDFYDCVTPCKAMTQKNRRKHLPDVNINTHESLPPYIPHEYDQLIMNRTWKTKVINLIIESMPKLLSLKEEQTLIIDWCQHATKFTANAEPVRDIELPPLGENDVKAMRYTRYGNMVIDTTDGDFIPIALIHLERIMETMTLRHETVNPMEDIPQVAIFRMECNTNTQRAPPKINPKDQKIQRRYEFLHINRLYKTIRNSIQIATAGNLMGNRTHANTPNTANHEMRMVALLIALTGTDFTKGLPYMSPKKVWDNLYILWNPFRACYDPRTMSLDVMRTANTVISRLYASVYHRHITNDRIPMGEVADRLKRHSSLSQTVKTRLPEQHNITCLIKNSNWVMQYWLCPEDGAYPNPVAEQYGYVKTKKGATAYEDDT